MPNPEDTGRDRGPGERESHEPPEGERERKKPAEDTEDKRVDREAAETFPASDPPANY